MRKVKSKLLTIQEGKRKEYGGIKEFLVAFRLNSGPFLPQGSDGGGFANILLSHDHQLDAGEVKQAVQYMSRAE